ncbi:MAG: hypothetical protein A3I68_07535 [Candidatus Melainabacteria bacterium RIFCSPLOWO2_02_FULL_35_15]|nr:MAG: hypothetical protein A3F80_01950 [Candidatus Melainabacteria bacterium RIFCSPLOWO2_12_FULL_35_11]OGI12772.1 MAG: hypothetical protein A3I68_07535 [Candidatus Melainabacteria bacterium RIFCSPLOWO2_02_FULL_35_15]
MFQDYRKDKKVKMKSKAFIFLLILFIIPLRVNASPQYMNIFNKDKFARPEMKNMCSVCHVNSNGGGPVNNFGMVFDTNGFKITNDLRQKFPELFKVVQSLVPKITRVKPVTVPVGQEVKIMIVGNNFANDSTVKIDGSSENIQATFVNPKNIDVTITFSNTGVHTVQVVNTTGQASNVFKVKAKPRKQ